MKIFSLILACFFFTFAASAESAADVLIDYVEKNLSPEEYKQLRSKWENKMLEDTKRWLTWEDQMSNHTKAWRTNETINFLKYLEDRIGKKALLGRIKAFDFLTEMSFYGFLAHIDFYERFLDKKEVTNQLKKSLIGFQSGDLEEMERAVKYIEHLVGREVLVSMMKKDISSFPKTDVNTLENVFKNVSSIVGRKQAEILIKENLSSFIELDEEKMENIIEVVQDRAAYALLGKEVDKDKRKRMARKILIDAIISDFEGFASFSRSRLGGIEHYLQKKFDLPDFESFEITGKHIKTFMQIKVESIEAIPFEFRWSTPIEWELNISEKRKVTDVLKKNPKILSDIDALRPLSDHHRSFYLESKQSECVRNFL